MAYVAMDLFDLTETEILRGQVRTIEKSVDNLRRGLFVRHDELAKKFLQVSEGFERLIMRINLLEEKQKHYEAALFPEMEASASLATPVDPGLRSISAPVSLCMTLSQASSTGLSAPRK